MEIKAKEVTNLTKFNQDYEKHTEDPSLYAEPRYEFVESIIGLPEYDILSYRILSKGIIEPEKTEIHITTHIGIINCNYSAELHKKLKNIIEYNEKIDREERLNYKQKRDEED